MPTYGLEEMDVLEKVKSKEDLEQFLLQQILPSLERLIPYLRYCAEAVENRDYNELLKLNEEISAWKLTRELRDAENSQGTQLFRMLLEIHPCSTSAEFNNLLQDKGHHASKLPLPLCSETLKGTLKTFDDCMDLPSRFKLLLGISKIVEIGGACMSENHPYLHK